MVLNKVGEELTSYECDEGKNGNICYNVNVHVSTHTNIPFWDSYLNGSVSTFEREFNDYQNGVTGILLRLNKRVIVMCVQR